MAFSFVQSAKTPDDTTVSPTATFDDPPTVGNLMVGVILMDSVSGTPDIDDLELVLAGWTTDIGPVGVPAVNNRLQAMWIIHRIAGASESSTVAPILNRISTGGHNAGFIVIAEYDDGGSSAGVSVSDDGDFAGPSDSAVFPALVPTAGRPTVLVAAVGHEPNYTASVSDGWTIRGETNIGGSRQAIALVDQIVASATGAYTGSASVAGLGESHWLIPIVAYGTAPEPGVWVDWDND